MDQKVFVIFLLQTELTLLDILICPFILSGHFYWLFATMIHRDDDYDGEYEVTIFNVFAGMATCLSVGDVSKWY